MLFVSLEFFVPACVRNKEAMGKHMLSGLGHWAFEAGVSLSDDFNLQYPKQYDQHPDTPAPLPSF